MSELTSSGACVCFAHANSLSIIYFSHTNKCEKGRPLQFYHYYRINQRLFLLWHSIYEYTSVNLHLTCTNRMIFLNTIRYCLSLHTIFLIIWSFKNQQGLRREKSKAFAAMLIRLIRIDVNSTTRDCTNKL